MSGTWTAAYARYGEHHDEEFDTLRQAVAFASRGIETWDYSVVSITGPDGEVIEGDDLDEAQLHFDLGDEDHDRARVAKWRPRLADTPNAVTSGESPFPIDGQAPRSTGP